jgi:two-component system alkaline phosphatase synthesis response regulator PhoP
MKDNKISQAGELSNASLQFHTNPTRRILVVDDESQIRQFITEVLSRFGYKVDAADNGVAAWDALNTNSYDLMITDNTMPKLSGVELLKKLHAARMDVPVIMATGTLPQEEFTRYPWLQPAATLLKPYTLGELLRMVKGVLGEAKGAGSHPKNDYLMI